jgi:large subunit ribosomal protein L24
MSYQGTSHVLVKPKIRKNDQVKIIAGNEKGKTGKVLYVDRRKGRVLLEGMNLKKKHVKPSNQRPKGGIIDIEAPLDISNIRLVCPKCSKPTKVLHKILKDGRKVRTCGKCSEIIDKT